LEGLRYVIRLGLIRAAKKISETGPGDRRRVVKLECKENDL
jgi:hypothetical protein